MSKQQTYKLLPLTGWFVFAGILSYMSAKLFTPALFPYWGIALLLLLGIWAAISINTLLTNSRRSRWVLIVLLMATSIMGVSVSWSGLAAVLMIVVAIAILGITTLLIGLLRLLRQHLSPRWLLLGFVPMLGGTLLLAVANLTRPTPPALLTDAKSVNAELRYMFEMDQSDRNSGRFVLDSTRDQARLQRLLILDRQGLITTAKAQYHAAMILQHGTCPDHFRRAYELADAAAKAQIPNAEWLSHASYDRWMLSIGKPQKYNTQWLVSQQSTCNASTYE